MRPRFPDARSRLRQGRLAAAIGSLEQTAPPMRPVLFVTLWILITGLLVAQSTPDPATATRNRAFVNGRVFDGQRFVAEPLHVTADGLFSRSRPSDAEVVDLAGGYVIPPFGEGHNHNLDSEGATNRYLRTGVFYVSNPNTHPGQHSKLPPRLNSPTASMSNWPGASRAPAAIRSLSCSARSRVSSPATRRAS